MKYDLKKTQSHILVQEYTYCLKEFNEILLNEDDNLNCKPNIFNNKVLVIDIDEAEKMDASAKKRARSKTMDIAFSISNKNTVEILLVELKLNYKNVNNISRSDILGKVNGAKSLLGNLPRIMTQYVFIFQPNKVQEARNRLQRIRPRIPNNYIAMDLTKLKQIYF